MSDSSTKLSDNVNIEPAGSRGRGQSRSKEDASLCCPGFWGDDRQCLSVRLDDPDAHHDRAKAAGASIVQEPHDTPYGARGYYVRDLEGFLWGFSTYQPGSPG